MKTHSNWCGLFAVVGICSMVGCGGASPEPTTPEPPAPGIGEPAPEPEEAAPPDTSEPNVTPAGKIKFDDMAPADKLNLMKTVVAPNMAKTFQSLDAEKYKDFGCVTCHGPGAKSGEFEMPSEALPKLPKDIGEVFKSAPEVAKFMSEQVVPQMAEILGEEPYNPETHEGFGCLDCHQQQ